MSAQYKITFPDPEYRLAKNMWVKVEQKTVTANLATIIETNDKTLIAGTNITINFI